MNLDFGWTAKVKNKLKYNNIEVFLRKQSCTHINQSIYFSSAENGDNALAKKTKKVNNFYLNIAGTEYNLHVMVNCTMCVYLRTKCTI